MPGGRGGVLRWHAWTDILKPLELTGSLSPLHPRPYVVLGLPLSELVPSFWSKALRHVILPLVKDHLGGLWGFRKVACVVEGTVRQTVRAVQNTPGRARHRF